MDWLGIRPCGFRQAIRARLRRGGLARKRSRGSESSIPLMSRVFVDRFDTPERLPEKVAEALRWIRADQIIRPGMRVFIKPNLTWRTPTPGVTVTPYFIRTLVEQLLPLSS